MEGFPWVFYLLYSKMPKFNFGYWGHWASIQYPSAVSKCCWKRSILGEQGLWLLFLIKNILESVQKVGKKVELKFLWKEFDFTAMGGVLLVALICLMMFGFFALIFPGNNIVNIVYASLGALIFGIYIVFDTQLMMGGKHK